MTFFEQITNANRYACNHADTRSIFRQTEPYAAVKNYSFTELICNHAESEHSAGLFVVAAETADFAL